ncbi:MAG: leucyl/phenylalanyl-tRNA--protein transferase [Spirochaetota bacterium]|jgi:leucyl/phenylalanyl-tRNA--protein transferase|nr:leucyl/phenylalanyl-tRNA--protein transferase [Spirochaetota bacterium]
MTLPLWLDDSLRFPNPGTAHPQGLLALGGDLSSERLLAAYGMGIFPWYGEDDPIMWWCPDPRAVIFPNEFHLSRRLLRRMRRRDYVIRVDSAFAEVIGMCANIPRAGEDGTWILPEMMDAYIRLHHEGHAHSVEFWLTPDAAEEIPVDKISQLRSAPCAGGYYLAGGCYGVYTGSVFCGESMFSLARGASKIALAALSYLAGRIAARAIDCQFMTPHLASLGAGNISRERYLALLAAPPDNNTYSDWGAANTLFADPAWVDEIAGKSPTFL